MMTKAEVTERIDDLQKQLNKVSNDLMAGSPLAQAILGKMQAYNAVLADKKVEKKEEV